MIVLSDNVIGGQSSGVNEGDHDVASSFRDPEPLVPVGEPAGVHEGPPNPGPSNTAVVPQEPAATALVREGGGHEVGTHTRGGWSMQVATPHSQRLVGRGPR